MTKKNVHEANLSIIQKFVDMVNKDNLLELEYEANDLKVKVVKNMKSVFSTPQETNVSFSNTRENREPSKSTEKVEPHPQVPCALGLLNSKRDPI